MMKRRRRKTQVVLMVNLELLCCGNIDEESVWISFLGCICLQTGGH